MKRRWKAAPTWSSGIQPWRRERPDIDSSGKSVVGRLLRLEEEVLRTLNQVLEPFGMKYQEYAVLATLRVAGAPYRLSPSRLQEHAALHFGWLVEPAEAA